PVEVFAAVAGLGRRGRAVARWAALDRIANVDFFSLEAAGDDDAIEQLAGLTDEGLALPVFIGPRGFTDEAELGIDRPDAEDRLGACGGQLGAARAAGDRLR